MLNRFENHILNTAEEGIAYVREIDKPNVKVMLDTFHMNTRGRQYCGSLSVPLVLCWDIFIQESVTGRSRGRGGCPGERSVRPSGTYPMAVLS